MLNPQHTNNFLSLFFIIVLLFLSILLFLAPAKPFGLMGHAPVLNMDSMIYAQFAKTIANGHAYEFNAGEQPVTGSSSHLYVWILAGLHKTGIRGLELLDADADPEYCIECCFFLFLLAHPQCHCT
ncbi:MAG: hypothetical protein U5R06_04490 [candidate division KSB1 bacterium]|nr:hypothetical protein [candidate division KSB1 bacterium]